MLFAPGPCVKTKRKEKPLHEAETRRLGKKYNHKEINNKNDKKYSL